MTNTPHQVLLNHFLFRIGSYLAAVLLNSTAASNPVAATSHHLQTGMRTSTTELSTLLPGIWRGVHSIGMTTYHYRFTLKREGEKFNASGISWCCMSEAQAEESLQGKLDVSLFPGLPRNFAHPVCIQQHFAVSLQGDLVTLQTTVRDKIVLVMPVKYFSPSRNVVTEANAALLERLEEGTDVSVLVHDADDHFRPAQPVQRDRLLKVFDDFPPIKFTGQLTTPGIISQDPSRERQSNTHFHFWKEELLSAPHPPTIELGKTTAVDCLDGGPYHYTCYLPRQYRPERPMPVLFNFSPSGNAQPASPKLAEELGWIMVGLTESSNGAWDVVSPNRDAVLLDLRRRFAIDMKQLYFCGFSGGARASALAAFDYPKNCAGALCVGASSIQSTPQRHIPIYYLVGDSDVTRAETTEVFEAEKKAGRTTAFVLHAGGHVPASTGEMEAGIRWLAAKKESKITPNQNN